MFVCLSGGSRGKRLTIEIDEQIGLDLMFGFDYIIVIKAQLAKRKKKTSRNSFYIKSKRK